MKLNFLQSTLLSLLLLFGLIVFPQLHFNSLKAADILQNNGYTEVNISRTIFGECTAKFEAVRTDTSIPVHGNICKGVFSDYTFSFKS